MDELHDPKIPPRYRWKVKPRVAGLDYAARYGIKPVAERFGLDRKPLRAWRTRRGAGGAAGVVPREPARRARRGSADLVALGAHARRERHYGATRTQVWLVRVHQRRVAQATLHRLVRDLGLPRLRRTKTRAPKPFTLFETPPPGDAVQVDVKVGTIAGQTAFPDTVLDDCPRYRGLRLHRWLPQRSRRLVLRQLRRAFPVPTRTRQGDTGPEFPLACALALQAAGLQHRDIRPRGPQQNGTVERSHRIDSEECWGRQAFADFDTAAAALQGWEHPDPHERFSLARQGRTPAENLAALLPTAQAA